MLTGLQSRALLLIVTAGGIGVAALLPPMPQDSAYHQFADDRTLAAVPYFWNVLSNVGFALAGAIGLFAAPRVRSPELRTGYLLFCVAVMAVSAGSSWYHYAPSNATLVWDRLPMSVAFMALFSMVLGDRVSWRLAGIALWPLAAAGAASVWYWHWTELHGAGDLRAYGVVQFLPMLIMPLVAHLVSRPPREMAVGDLRWSSRSSRRPRTEVDHEALGFSGHSIKHLLGAAAVLCAIPALLALDPARREFRVGFITEPPGRFE